MTAIPATTDAEVVRLTAHLRDLIAAEQQAAAEQDTLRAQIGTVVAELTRRGLGYRRISALVGANYVTLYRRAAQAAETTRA